MLSARLAYLRKEKDKTQEEMANFLGITRPAYTAYESGRRQPDYSTIQKLADYFNVTVDYLLGRDELDITEVLEGNKIKLVANGQPINQDQRLGIVRVLDNPSTLQTRTIPILGKIKMGIPILAEENYDGELDIPSDIEADFALEARGKSMIGVGLLDSDWAICKQAQTAYSGDIVVALRDEGGFSEATLKYYFNGKEGPLLRAANPEYDDIPMSEGWRIAGVLVAVLRKEAPPYRVYNSYLAARDVNKEKWDPVFEKACQMGIEPEQVMTMLETMYKVMKGR
ncbi:MAG: helix-turn-helix domain-containing protein [Firmicutes bacterium]|nr:helix-turn-helix domain-containing protein [Bacillota bacterium]